MLNMKTLKQTIPDFLDYLEIEKGLSDNSQNTYGRFVNKFLNWLELNRKLNVLPSELNEPMIWNYRLYLARNRSPKTKKLLSKNSQNLHLIALRNLLGYFVEKNIKSLPPEKIKLAKAAKPAPKFLKLEQLEQLFAAPNLNKKNGLRDRAILEMLFSTGMRISELISLKKQQIIFSQIPSGKNLELFITGKGGHTRPVYFSPRSLDWLKQYLFSRRDSLEALFIAYRGQKAPAGLTARSIERLIKRYALKAGLPMVVSPHTLRHSYATDLLSKGVDLRLIQEFLGHKNIATTQVYTHVVSKQLKDIHEKYHGTR